MTDAQQQPYVIDVVQEAGSGKFRALPNMRAFPNVPKTNTQPEPTRGRVPRNYDQGFRWAPWGVNDCFPTEVRTKINQVPMAGQAVYRLVAMMYGNGLAYYRNSDMQDGDNKVSRAYIPAVEQWLQRNFIRHRWLIPQFVNYRHVVNTFSEFILNKRRDFITGIYHKESEFCRLSRQDESTMRSEYLYFSPDFSEEWAPPNERIQAIPLADWQNFDDWVERFRGYKFAWHSYYWSAGAIYYPTPPWVGLFRNGGWIDASIAVPEVVNAMMRNQILLKYQILIPESYFALRHAEWNTYDDAKRKEVMDELSTMLETELSDTENAFKSITTVFRQDIQGNAQGKIEIVAIDDKVKRDSWVPSSEKADSQVVQGLGLHPSQLGLSPEGGKMGAGSGSDQRESYNTAISLNTLEQEIVLEPLNLMARFNSRVNPDFDITFFIDHTMHTTTNAQESGLQPSDTTLITN